MDENRHGETTASGFAVNTVSLTDVRQKLAEVKQYFQEKHTTLENLQGTLEDTFFGGGEGETGAFQWNFQVFGHEWINQFRRVLAH